MCLCDEGEELLNCRWWDISQRGVTSLSLVSPVISPIKPLTHPLSIYCCLPLCLSRALLHVRVCCVSVSLLASDAMLVCVCVPNLAWVLCDVVQACRKQVVLHGHVQTLPVLVGQQRVQVSGHQGQSQQAAILYQFWQKEQGERR